MAQWGGPFSMFRQTPYLANISRLAVNVSQRRRGAAALWQPVEGTRCWSLRVGL